MHCRIVFTKNDDEIDSRGDFLMAQRGAIQRIADATGVNQKTVRRVLAFANINAETCDFDEAVKCVIENADPSRIDGHAFNGRGEGGAGEAASSYADVRSKAEGLRARKIELEIAQTEGRLIDRQSVTETGARIIGDVRTALLALGYRLAEKVAGKTDIPELYKIIEAEVRDVLGALASDEAFFNRLTDEALS